MVSLALAKEHLEYEDDDRDTLIEQYIDAARGWVEGYTGLLLSRRTVVRRLRATCSEVDVIVGPDPDVKSVKYFDSDYIEQTMDPADYVIDGGLIIAKTRFPSSSLKVSVEAGFSDDGTPVPAKLISAQLLLVGHFFAHREAVITGAVPSEVDFAVKALCQSHCQMLV